MKAFNQQQAQDVIRHICLPLPYHLRSDASTLKTLCTKINFNSRLEDSVKIQKRFCFFLESQDDLSC